MSVLQRKPPTISLVVRHHNDASAKPNPLVDQLTPDDARMILEGLTLLNPASGEARARRNALAAHFALLTGKG